jgi:hypothetical protein
MMPPLPKPDFLLPEGKYTFEIEAQHINRLPFYTEAQLIAYGRQCVEAAADLITPLPDWKAIDERAYAIGVGLADCILNMLKGED